VLTEISTARTKNKKFNTTTAKETRKELKCYSRKYLFRMNRDSNIKNKNDIRHVKNKYHNTHVNST
jgi:hypothetical protein